MDSRSVTSGMTGFLSLIHEKNKIRKHGFPISDFGNDRVFKFNPRKK